MALAPAAVQRTNSLQASDTSHTSTATDTSTSNTSASTSPSKPSPVSSIGESISCSDAPPLPAIPPPRPPRPVRPLPMPPLAALTSTSTLKLSHQESHSTLGKTTKSQSVPQRKHPRPPPDDSQWVSISLLPAVAERFDPAERQSQPAPRTAAHQRSASADPRADSAFGKHATRITPAPSRSAPAPPRQAETSWELEFRGVVKLVRWVSRRDKRPEPAVNGEPVLDEKDVGVERKGIASFGRKSRDGMAQTRPDNGPDVPARRKSTARPPPKVEGKDMEAGEIKEAAKRRLTKSNPVLASFGRASSELKKQPSTELKKRASTEKRSSRRTSSDAAQKMLAGAIQKANLELGQQTSRDSPRSSVDAGTLNAGASASHAIQPSCPAPGASARVPSNGSALSDGGSATVAPTSYSAPRLRTLASPGIAPALVTQTTTITHTTTLATPSGITSTPFIAHNYISTTSTILSPVLEGPLVASPPEIETTAEFPWVATLPGLGYHHDLVGVAVTGGLSPVDSNAISSIISSGGGSASPVVSSSVSPVETGTTSPPSNGSVSSSVSPLASSPLMSATTSPWLSPSLPMSAVTSPSMSISASPVLLPNAHLAETSLYPHHVPVAPLASVDTPATSSSLSYATARSNRNSLSAQIEATTHIGRYAATDLGHGHTIDPRFLSAPDARFGAPDLARFSAAATDIGHGTSTRATSPAPSERWALSDDLHDYRPQQTHGILRALGSADAGAPLPMPRRPFLGGRDSSGSVTFDDSSAQSSPRIGGRRGMMTMSSSDVGHGSRSFASRHQVQRSTSTMSIAGRIMRSLSIGRGQGDESEGSRITRKLTRKKTPTHSRGSSTASLTITNGAVPPVPPLPPGIVSGKCVSECGHGSVVGHGDGSVIGHGDGSVLGHGQEPWGRRSSQWDGSSSVLGHGTGATSPVTTRFSSVTTQSAPPLGGGRKLIKKRQPSQPRPIQFGLSGSTLASLNLPGDVSRDPPRITTQFVQDPLMDIPLTASADGTTQDSHLMAPRPGLPRRTSSQRRWTIADMDDEEFLRQLEAKLSGAGGRLRKSRMLEEFVMGADQNGAEPEDDHDHASDSDGSMAEREWVRARRAMMCVREIVRTEKSYLRHLVGFFSGEDADGVSSILAEHLPRLIETSHMFCTRLEEDPSAWGVSSAFLGIEDQLEATLVQWSGVVGEVISSTHHRSESQAVSEDGHTSSAGSGSAGSSWIRRRSATANTAMQLNLSMTPVNGSNGKNKKSTRGTKGKKMTEQDVVIMPTQRAIRYVLMYRELLLHTPVTSASRPLVERALQGATRIARKCDEAQTHADHILSP